MSRIVEFLEGRGCDHAGRTVSEVLSFGLGALESQHDFIQWLFPTTKPSGAMPNSPVLTLADIATLKASAIVRANLSAARGRMAWFYEQTDHWFQPHNHNHARITRIITSTRLLTNDLAANAFRAAILAKVEQRRAPIGEPTLRYWREA